MTIVDSPVVALVRIRTKLELAMTRANNAKYPPPLELSFDLVDLLNSIDIEVERFGGDDHDRP